MKEEEIQDELVSIRNLMERSSKFISLSGLSGILAGIYALIGAAFTYYSLYDKLPGRFNPYITHSIIINNIRTEMPVFNRYFVDYNSLSILLVVAFLILIASIGTGIFFSIRKAKYKGQPIWSTVSRALLFHMVTPLLTGGILVLVLIAHRHYEMIAPGMLIFYGLSLVSASNFTFTDVKYLGLCEIILGLIAACLPGYGLLFWAIGFGVLHIVYGSMMYFKYDR